MSICCIRCLFSLLHDWRDKWNIIIKMFCTTRGLALRRQVVTLLNFSILVSCRHFCRCSRGFFCSPARGASPLLPAGRPVSARFPWSLRVSSACLRAGRCCTNASSSRCISSSMRALHSSECGFVTLCAPPARATQASHPGVGPYRATSCFKLYLRLCCGVQTIASGASITTAGTGAGFRLFSNEHPWKSSELSNEFVVPLLVCGFPLNSRASQQSTF